MMFGRFRRNLRALELENARLLAEKAELECALAVARAASEHRVRHSEHGNRLSLLGTMLAQVAHEINNPLTFILLNLPRVSHLLPLGGELLTPAARAEILEVLADMEEGSERIQALARELKAFSSRDSGAPSAVDLADVAAASLRMLSGVLPSSVRLLQQHEPSPPVVAPRARLIQVVINLVKNAAEASPRNTPCTVRVRSGVSDDGYSFLRVEDDGPGISEDVRRRIFDPFFTTRAEAGGTGLGLAICREIIAELEGRIDVRSRPGLTEFEVLLPPLGRTRLSNGDRTP